MSLTVRQAVPLTRRAIAILSKAAEACTKPDQKMFDVKPYSITQAIRRARRELGLSEDYESINSDIPVSALSLARTSRTLRS